MRTHRIAQLASLIALVAAIALVPAALAGKPPSAAPCSVPTLTGPTAAFVGGTYTVNACGFQPGQFVALSLAEAGGCCLAFNTVADSAGRFTYTGNVSGAGKYSVTASVRSHNRWRVAAQWSFEAYP